MNNNCRLHARCNFIEILIIAQISFIGLHKNPEIGLTLFINAGIRGNLGYMAVKAIEKA